MFRDRTVFKALLEDFIAYLRHGSHGTLGSIKTRQATDTSTYFSSTKSSNLCSVQSTQRNSGLLHANPCFSFSLLSPSKYLGKPPHTTFSRDGIYQP